MAKYDVKVALDFCKAMEESKIVKKNSHKNSKVISTLVEVINASEDEIKATSSSSVQMIYHEFGDWIETYAG